MTPAVVEKHSEDVALELFNKRRYTFILMMRKLDSFIYFLVRGWVLLRLQDN